MYKQLLINKKIRYYLLGGGVSKLGDVLTGMAFLFITYDVTGSSLHTTGMAIAETLPYLFFGLIGGVTADWLPRRKLLILLDLLRTPLLLMIVCLYYLDMLNYMILLIINFLMQSAGCFFNPAHRTVLASITTEAERVAANSANDTLSRGVTVLSPVISVWLLNTFGAIHFFTIDTITFLISAYCILKIDLIDEKNVAPRHKKIKAALFAIFEFVHWVRKQVTIKKLFLFTFITVFFNTWVWEVGMLLALSKISSASEQLYSILQGLFGGIVIVTNIIIPYFIKKMTLRHYFIGSIIWATGITYYGLLYDIPHFFIGAAIVGIGMPLASLTRVYIVQSLVPEDKMGRAFSFNAVLLYFSNTISLALYGIFSLHVSIQFLMCVSGIFMLLVSLIGLLSSIYFTKFSRRFPIHFHK